VIDGPDFSPDVPAILGIISNALPILKKENMVLALENHERLKAADFAGIVEKIGSDHVGICLDTVNSLGAGEGLDAVVELLGPMTVNLHVKDYRIKRLDHQMGVVVEGCPAGDGMLDLPRILERLGDRCRSAVLEQWTPAAENLAGTIAREAAWAKKSISYLKKWIK
jgi:sugar phosphate isomerase/epimerase